MSNVYALLQNREVRSSNLRNENGYGEDFPGLRLVHTLKQATTASFNNLPYSSVINGKVIPVLN
jgi:hypothetical protein